MNKITDISDEEQEEIDKAWEAALEEEWRMKSLENDLTPIVKNVVARSTPGFSFPILELMTRSAL